MYISHSSTYPPDRERPCARTQDQISCGSRALQGRWSRGRDARTTTKAGLRRLSRAGPSMAPPRLKQPRRSRDRFAPEAVTCGAAGSWLPCGGSGSATAARRHAYNCSTGAPMLEPTSVSSIDPRACWSTGLQAPAALATESGAANRAGGRCGNVGHVCGSLSTSAIASRTI